MQTYEFSLTQKLTVSFTFPICARDRRHAERLIARRMAAGGFDGELDIKIGERGEFVWDGNPQESLRLRKGAPA